METRQVGMHGDVRAVVPLYPGRRIPGEQVTRRRFLVLAAGAAGSALLAACGGGTAATDTPKPNPPTAAPAPTAPIAAASPKADGQVLVIEAVEYGFKTMGSIPAGVTTLQLRNLGQELHEGQLVRLNDGVTVAQFMDAFKQTGPNSEPPPIFSYEGGPGQTKPAGTAEVILDLKEGQYVLLCFIRGPDKQPHAAKGMVMPFTVTAATGNPTALPAGVGQITLGAASLGLPATLSAGKSMYRLTNGGKSPHAFFYGRIPADKTLDDMKQAAASQAGPPPWFEALGGMDGLKPGGTGVVALDLTPGNYAAVDIVYGPEPPTAMVFKVN